MTDRKPGAPGQFKAVITTAELEKLQNGEQFIITLTRDDQPVTEGTPYSKAAVLPDELAAVICPSVTDPVPADALAGLLPLNGGAAMTGALPMGGNGITDLADPASDLDAVNKKYVDGKATKITSLWRNAAWTSSFVSQVVTWENDETYDAYIVTFCYSNSYGHEISVLVNNYLVYQGRNGSAYYAKGSPAYGSDVLDAVNRNFSVYGAGNGCSFGSGYLNGSANNAYCIPMSIYGIKW